MMHNQDISQHFLHMKKARIAEEKSPHEIHKVGALLISQITGENVSSPNYWPERLERTIGRQDKLGNASTTIHAELATLCTANYPVEGATLYVTDLPCPNCAKTLVEAGIENIYIDAHSHNTPLGIKMAPFFENVSLSIFRARNIGVVELDLENGTKRTWNKRNADQKLLNPQALWMKTYNQKSGLNISDLEKTAAEIQTQNIPYAACFARQKTGNKIKSIITFLNPSIGLTETERTRIESAQDKYSPNIRPINRLIGICARHGLNMIDGTLLSSQTPTSREFVNLIGANQTGITIKDRTLCRDQEGLEALEQIEKHKIINILSL